MLKDPTCSMVLPLVATSAAVAAAVSWLMLPRHDLFAPGACTVIEPYLLTEVVGQELAIQQTSDAICDHLLKKQPQKPLVLSVHGPPGIGKSLSHRLLAQALYATSDNIGCPGSLCPGYRVSSRSLLLCLFVSFCCVSETVHLPT